MLIGSLTAFALCCLWWWSDPKSPAKWWALAFLTFFLGHFTGVMTWI